MTKQTNVLDELDLDEFSVDDVNDTISQYDDDDIDDRSSKVLDDFIESETKSKAGRDKPFYKNIFLMVSLGLVLIIIIIGINIVANKTEPVRKTAPVKTSQASNTRPTEIPVAETANQFSGQAVKGESAKQSRLPIASNKGTIGNKTDVSNRINKAEVNKALSFVPGSAAADKNTLEKIPKSSLDNEVQVSKLRSVNAALNSQLSTKEKTIKQLKVKLADIEKANVDLALKSLFADRQKISGMQLIDFAGNNTIAIVRVTRTAKENIIALTKDELLRVGNHHLTVNEINIGKRYILVGTQYYIDTELTPFEAVSKVAGKKQKATKVVPRKQNEKLIAKAPSDELKGRLQPILDWSVAAAATDNSYIVVTSNSGIVERLVVGSRLSGYGEVLNILGNGTLIFKNHILHNLVK